ncbi:killer cell lectin-like receptor subfamily B member 1B allele A [Alligator mississippiensis]|uniref:Killer cell lectin-like receptor subfamily B member 1B allele A n=1 Tax=Alligator mississippiensis TaxID=8496 RepID=A0A151MZK3_ALLMI|nr:killer cell lectin-like receptor subfamily B member 1B allele A [Alligator mississippiensis]
MAGEIVYADLNVPSEPPCPKLPSSRRKLSPQVSPRWHRVALCAAWIGNIILGTAVIAMVLWGNCGHAGTPEAGSGNTSSTTGSACQEQIRSDLIQSLCPPPQHSSAEGPGCRLCPVDWKLHGDKCYWVSSKPKSWSESREDCAARSSQLLLIQDREELDFMKNLTKANKHFWIGLFVPSPEKGWTWLNGSQLNPAVLPVPSLPEGKVCGAVSGNQIQSESCSTGFLWICQKDAVLIQLRL